MSNVLATLMSDNHSQPRGVALVFFEEMQEQDGVNWYRFRYFNGNEVLLTSNEFMWGWI